MPLPMSDLQLATIARRVQRYADYGGSPPMPEDMRALVRELYRMRADFANMQAELRMQADAMAGRRRPVF